MLLQSAGIDMPQWVKATNQKSGVIRNPEKLRRNQPKEEVTTEPAESAAPSEESTVEA
jgi:hypothetical protein